MIQYTIRYHNMEQPYQASMSNPALPPSPPFPALTSSQLSTSLCQPSPALTGFSRPSTSLASPRQPLQPSPVALSSSHQPSLVLFSPL